MSAQDLKSFLDEFEKDPAIAERLPKAREEVKSLFAALDTLSGKLPCDVLVQPHTLISAGCSVNTLMECIEMRRKRYEKGPPLPNIISRTQADEIQSLRQRVERLEGSLREADISILGARMVLEGKATNATDALAKFGWGPSRTHIEGMRNTMNRAIEYIDEACAALSPKVQEGE